jgi:hypothetical protein
VIRKRAGMRELACKRKRDRTTDGSAGHGARHNLYAHPSGSCHHATLALFHVEVVESRGVDWDISLDLTYD